MYVTFNLFSSVLDPVKPSIDVPDQSKTIPLVDKPESVINVGDNITSLTETSLSIDCPVSGEPKPVVFWTKDGLPLNAEEGTFFIHTNGTLTIRGITSSGSGRYTCAAKNFAGKDSVSSEVTVVGT